MKKLVAGLAGIVIVGVGCATMTSYPYNDLVGKLRYHYSEINKLAEAKPGESCTFIDAAKPGEPVSLIVDGKEGKRIIIFYDRDKDGSYEAKSTIQVPNKLDLQVIPPIQKNPGIEKEKKYVPLDKKMVINYELSSFSDKVYTFI
jgi:hypothetical protein